MKWIKLPKLIPLMRVLILKDLASREDSISVLSIWDDKEKKKGTERKLPKAWRPIPNVQDFKLSLGPYDWLLNLFGLRKRTQSRKKFYTWYNENANKFIEFQFHSLSLRVKNGRFRAASETVWLLMNSAAYQVASTNHVLKNWHRKLSWKEILIISKQVDKLVKRRATEINYSRTYIPKGQTYRPLGVPTIPWRIYLHMYNNCLVEWRRVSETGKQHGYLPGKGIVTAWIQIVRRLNAPNIFEADYQGFFNNVTHLGIKSVLLNELHLTFEETNFIQRLNKSLVKLQAKDKIEEMDRKYPFDKDGEINVQHDPTKDPSLISANAFTYYMANPHLTLQQAVDIVKEAKREGKTSAFVAEDNSKGSEWQESGSNVWVKETGQGKPKVQWDPLTGELKVLEEPKEEPKAIVNEIHILDAVRQIRATKQIPSNLYYQDWSSQELSKDRGVPQGAPTSCSLATLAMRWIEKLDVVLYADDVIYFPKDSNCDPIKDLTKKKWGLIINEEKSRWIKKDGVWLVDSFKFLGIRYYPPSKWTFDKELLGILIFMMILDIALGFPICTLAIIIWELLCQWHSSKERFTADTRNGADLSFTNRESFISWLSVARELLLNSEYLQKRWASRSLSEWLDYNWRKWQALKNPLRLLFMEPFKNTEVEGAIEYYQKVMTRKDLQPGELERYNMKLEEAQARLWIHNPLTGYFLSRMQINSWEVAHTQNFRLNEISGSWCHEEWKRYCREWIIPESRLNVFVASTFACHDLMEWLEDYKQRKIKPTIRRVQTTPRRRTWCETIIHKVLNEKNLTSLNTLF